MDHLQLLIFRRDSEKMLCHLAVLVPEYKPQRAFEHTTATVPGEAATAGNISN
jgi:hypothetical protein